MKRIIISLSVILLLIAYISQGCTGDSDNPTASLNHPPTIDNIYANSTVLSWYEFKTSTITCFASDIDGDLLDYSWTCTSGSFIEGDSMQTVIWQPPSDTGSYYIIVTVDDGINSVDDMIEIKKVIPDTISGPLSGTLFKSIYFVNDISIEAEDSLVIEPGTIIFTNFTNEDSRFKIYGYLYSVGTEFDSIRYFGPISFYSNEDLSYLKYCRFDGSLYQGISSTGIDINGSSPTLSHCTITGYNSGGIYIGDSEAIIEYCAILKNKRSSGFYGAGIRISGSSPKINNCTISGNYGYNDGGGGIFIGGANAEITNSIISGNEGSAGGIYFTLSGGFNGSIKYCDLYNNESGAFAGNIPTYLGDVVKLNHNGDLCDDFFNIFINPLFVDEENDNYWLLEDSPCIDAGDPDSQYDPDNTISDIGAIYFEQ